MAKKTSKVNKTNNKVQKQENSKNKKSFFKDFKAELKKVVWPTPKQLVNNTVAVITIVLITAVIVFVLDLVFRTLDEKGIDKIREVITTNETTENSTTNETTLLLTKQQTTQQQMIIQLQKTVQHLKKHLMKKIHQQKMK